MRTMTRLASSLPSRTEAGESEITMIHMKSRLAIPGNEVPEIALQRGFI